MDMYTQLLAVAGTEEAEVPRRELVEHAVRCRAALASSGPTHEPSEGLALELRYDRALVALSGSVGIETSAHRFSPRTTERRRLEGELASRGIDLTAPGTPSARAPDPDGLAVGTAQGSARDEPAHRAAATRAV